MEAWYVRVVSKVTKDKVLLLNFLNHLVYGIQNFHCHHLAFQTKPKPYISSHLYWILDTLKRPFIIFLHAFFKFCLICTGKKLTAVNLCHRVSCVHAQCDICIKDTVYTNVCVSNTDTCISFTCISLESFCSCNHLFFSINQYMRIFTLAEIYM